MHVSVDFSASLFASFSFSVSVSVSVSVFVCYPVNNLTVFVPVTVSAF
jgi:hypothetical protein